MPREHVVAAGPHSLYGHAQATPNGVRPLDSKRYRLVKGDFTGEQSALIISSEWSKLINLPHLSSVNLWSLDVHCRWVPGTLSDVINMVTHRRRNTVPPKAKNRLRSTIRCLCTTRTNTHIANRTVPVISHISKAQGMCGTLSRKISGSGGYRFMSGTLSCTTTMTNAVIQVTRNAQTVNRQR